MTVHPIFERIFEAHGLRAACAAEGSASGEGASASERSFARHGRTLKALHESLFAPEFRMLETYGDSPKPDPTLSEVRDACVSALVFHKNKSADLAAEIAQRRVSYPTNQILLDEAVRLLAHHRAEISRIEDELAALQPMAAE